MTRVRVQKIESIRDPEGNLGKRIELIEDRVIPQFAVRPQTEEARMIQEVMKTVQQQIPVLSNQRTQFAVPKMVLFLTETEYEKLGISFDVNQLYELELSGQAIKFTLAQQ
ncbi:MAG: arcadin 1 [Candidatus Bathyarchaeota archaeon]|nr:arcadin 1 [Candidatus Bathyarchaeota archaeon]